MGAGSVELELSLTFVQFLQHNKIRFAAKLMPLRTEKKDYYRFVKTHKPLNILKLLQASDQVKLKKHILTSKAKYVNITASKAECANIPPSHVEYANIPPRKEACAKNGYWHNKLDLIPSFY